jgi:predicted TIM-barrel fold metal-dependent hydrolase
LPFWDLDATLKEVTRYIEMGHRGILFPTQPQAFGQPPLIDRHWDPLWSLAQDAGVAINFHVGSDADLDPKEALKDSAAMGDRALWGFISSMIFMGNVKGISELIFGGVLHRFPGLNFVSVESGVGYMPTVLETMDWQWRNSRVALEHPEYDLLPSEYFRRQIYACFWFERGPMFEAALQLYPDNMMWETDYPHPTSQSPGPATPALPPRKYAAEALQNMSDDIVGKVLHGNAARVYNLNVN